MSKSVPRDLFEAEPQAVPPRSIEYRLSVTLDVVLGGFRFDWIRPDSDMVVASGQLLPNTLELLSWFALNWRFEMDGRRENDGCNVAPSSVRALLKRIRQRLPLEPGGVTVGFRLDSQLQTLKPGVLYEIRLPQDQEWFSWLARPVRDFARLADALSHAVDTTAQARGRAALLTMIRGHLGLPSEPTADSLPASDRERLLRITIETVGGFVQLDWIQPGDGAAFATGRVTCSGPDELTWNLTADGDSETARSRHHLNSIRGQENHLRRELDRVDDYFENYEAELGERATRSRNENTKLKASQRVAAARAEHQRRRADQVQRHEIRVLPHFDALLLVAEPAWRTDVFTTQHHETRTVSALFIPRSRRWV